MYKIINAPDQITDELLDNVRFDSEQAPDMVQCYYLRYYPRTEIVQLARDRGLLTDDNIAKLERGEVVAPLFKLSEHDDPGLARMGTTYMTSKAISIQKAFDRLRGKSSRMPNTLFSRKCASEMAPDISQRNTICSRPK